METREQIIASLGDCPGCGEPIKDNIREVAQTIVTHRVDLHGGVNTFYDEEVWSEGEEHLFYECRACCEQFPRSLQETIGELIETAV